jgi:hypothetical protein
MSWFHDNFLSTEMYQHSTTLLFLCNIKLFLHSLVCVIEKQELQMTVCWREWKLVTTHCQEYAV